MKARHKRSVLVSLGVVGAGVAMYLVYLAIESNLFYFYSPSEVAEKNIGTQEAFRLGGMVEEGSVKRLADGLTVEFIVHDQTHKIPVQYNKILPDLFKEGSGVIAEGKLNAKGVFVANEVMAKHDEDYMPPEVKKALEKGQARAQAANP